MSSAFGDLLFWILLFAVLVVGFRWRQKRNRKDD